MKIEEKKDSSIDIDALIQLENDCASQVDWLVMWNIRNERCMNGILVRYMKILKKIEVEEKNGLGVKVKIWALFLMLFLQLL